MAFDWQTGYHRYHHYFTNVGQFYRRKEAKVYTEVVLSFLTAAFFLVFAIKPTLVTITGLLREIEDQKMVKQKLEKKIQDLGKAKNLYQALEADLYLINQALPENANLATLVKELEVLARTADIKLEVAQFNQAPLKGNSTESSFDFHLTVSGHYHNLKTFLEKLASLRRILSVSNFSFTQNEKKEDEIVVLPLSLELNNQAHFLKETDERD